MQKKYGWKCAICQGQPGQHAINRGTIVVLQKNGNSKTFHAHGFKVSSEG